MTSAPTLARHPGSLLKEIDLDKARFLALIDLAAELKRAKTDGTEQPRLTGRNIALIFEKNSTRTRCAFEVAAHDQGAHVTYLDPTGSHIGTEESIPDTARVLGRMFDGIEFRGFAQTAVEQLADYAGVPVWNGLTDSWHPTQMLADVLTMREHHIGPLEQLTYCFVGDGRNNVARSLLVTGALLGLDVRIAAPRALWPAPDVVATAQRLAATSGARVLVTEDAEAGVDDADFIYTDVWVSMGESADEWGRRVPMLLPYRVTPALMKASGKAGTRFMHCLPAVHDRSTQLGRRVYEQHGLEGAEVTDTVFESPASIVFDQAENRLHSIKAVLVNALGVLMRLVIALGGNALLERGEKPDATIQLRHVQAAARALAPLTEQHELVISFGNGPQIGLLALESATDPALSRPYPLDVLNAQTQGMIGYWLAQSLPNAGVRRPVISLVTQTLVDADDPAFTAPTKFVGAVYSEPDARRQAEQRGWTVARDGEHWRRVVPSPLPRAIVELDSIRRLLDAGTVVICGGGGTPVIDAGAGQLCGVEAVVDKDLTSALLGVAIGADRLLVLTDVAAVMRDFGTPAAAPVHRLDLAQLAAESFPAGSMGPKIEACRQFVAGTGRTATIGSLTDVAGLLAGTAGTSIVPAP